MPRFDPRPPPRHPKNRRNGTKTRLLRSPPPFLSLFPCFFGVLGGVLGGGDTRQYAELSIAFGGGHFETRPYKWQRKLRFCANRATAGRRRAAAWRGAAGRLAAGGCLAGSVRDSTRQFRGGVCAFWGVRGVSARRGLQPATRPFLGRLVKVPQKSIDTNG